LTDDDNPEPATALAVSFHLKQPDEDFDRDILAMPLVDTKIAALLGDNFGFGTLLPFAGPFQVREIDPGESMVLESTRVFVESCPNRGLTIEFRKYKAAKTALSAFVRIFIRNRISQPM